MPMESFIGLIICFVVFDTNKICIASGTTLNIICHSRSHPVSTINSSALSFAFHLQTGETVVCQGSPCQCPVVNRTAVQLTCPYLPANYDNANLSCYSQDDPSISVKASVHVRGRSFI